VVAVVVAQRIQEVLAVLVAVLVHLEIALLIVAVLVHQVKVMLVAQGVMSPVNLKVAVGAEVLAQLVVIVVVLRGALGAQD
jgi:hypothetical protein